MAEPGAMRLDAAPKRRQDIISSILSDYGDSRDADDDVDLDDYYTQAQPSPVPGTAAAPASPAAKDKPLPPLVGFQLRGACALAGGGAMAPAWSTLQLFRWAPYKRLRQASSLTALSQWPMRLPPCSLARRVGTRRKRT